MTLNLNIISFVEVVAFSYEPKLALSKIKIKWEWGILVVSLEQRLTAESLNVFVKCFLIFNSEKTE